MHCCPAGYTTWTYTPVPGPVPPSAARFAAVDAAVRAHNAGPTAFGTIPASLKEVAVDFSVNVTNTGSVDSDDVVLGFLVPPGAGVDGVPLQELFGCLPRSAGRAVLPSRQGGRAALPGGRLQGALRRARDARWRNGLCRDDSARVDLPLERRYRERGTCDALGGARARVHATLKA